MDQLFHGIGQVGDHGTVEVFLEAEAERLIAGHITRLGLGSGHPAPPAQPTTGLRDDLVHEGLLGLRPPVIVKRERPRTPYSGVRTQLCEHVSGAIRLWTLRSYGDRLKDEDSEADVVGPDESIIILAVLNRHRLSHSLIIHLSSKPDARTSAVEEAPATRRQSPNVTATAHGRRQISAPALFCDGAVIRHILDDLGALSSRARAFLDEHCRRSPISLADPGQWYECTGMDGDVVPGPAGGLERLTSFVTRFGGMTFCPERPGCYGAHQHPYEFERFVSSGWEELEDGDRVAVVGSNEGYHLTLSWSTGRIGVVQPDFWIAESATNLIESCALGQSVYTDKAWSEAVELEGKGAGWGLTAVSSDVFRGVVGEVVEASCEWNRWYLDEHVAVHGWRVTYEQERSEAVMAWYRDAEGRRRIEAVAGPLRPADQTRKTPG